MINHLPRAMLLVGGVLAACLALGAFALLRGIGPDTSVARERIAEAAIDRPVSEAGRIAADTTEEQLGDGVNDADDYARLGAAELQLARETADPMHYSRAEEAFRRALEIEPEHVEGLIGQGTLALARHDFAEALAIGERALALHPSVPRIHGIIGDALVELGRYDEALASVQRMVDLRPDLGSYSRVAYLRELHGDLPGAIDAMQQAVAAGGPSSENTEYVRVQLGHLLFAMGDLEAAEAAYAASLERLPGYVYAMAGLGRVRAAQGKVAEAIELYRAASDQAPLPEFLVALGEVYEAAGRDEDAQDQYELVEAIYALQKANGVETDVELAAFVADHGDPQRAVAVAREAYARTPNVRAADALAWALHRSGQSDDAARYADEAIAIGWADSRALFHAGVIAAANEQPEVAQERLGRALALNPAFSPLQAPMAADALAELDPEP